MKQNEKQKTESGEPEDFMGLLMSLAKEILKPAQAKIPPLNERPVTIQIIVLPRKKGIIRRFFNWLW